MNQELPADLPVLTEVVAGDELPLLTEVVEETPATPAELPAPASTEPAGTSEPPAPTAELDARLESLIMEHLLPRLEAAQRKAIAQALAEFKQELPRLLHETQDNPPAT